VTFTVATAGGSGTPTGTVTLYANGTPMVCASHASAPLTLASGTTTCNYLWASPGSFTITAGYSGDVDYAPATYTPGFTETVS
jgi:hypothetical protein